LIDNGGLRAAVFHSRSPSMMKALCVMMFTAACMCGPAGAAEPLRVLGLPLGEKLASPVKQCPASEIHGQAPMLCWTGRVSIDKYVRKGTVRMRTKEPLPHWAAHATISARVERDGTLSGLTVETSGPGGYRAIKDALSAQFDLPASQDALSAPKPQATWNASGLSVKLACAGRCQVHYRSFVEWSPPSDAAIAALAPGPDQRWRLHVRDLTHRTRVAATVRFTKDAAKESCMVGNWKRLVVEAVGIRDEQFFPLAEALAYTIENGELVAGRTGVCDGYLFLGGKPGKQSIAGDFRATGLGYSEKLGDFELTVDSR
jgi:hypothetical protein